MSRLSLTIISAATLLAAVPAYAYVDPGTGSLAIQFLIGGIVAAGFVLKTYYYEVKRKIFKLIGRDVSDLPAAPQQASDGPSKPE